MGTEGTRNTVRIFKGGEIEGLKVFKELTKDAKLIPSNYPGDLYLLKDGSRIGYRPLSKFGPPTIDIKISGLKDNIKMKFLEKN